MPNTIQHDTVKLTSSRSRLWPARYLPFVVPLVLRTQVQRHCRRFKPWLALRSERAASLPYPWLSFFIDVLVEWRFIAFFGLAAVPAGPLLAGLRLPAPLSI